MSVDTYLTEHCDCYLSRTNNHHNIIVSDKDTCIGYLFGKKIYIE